MNCKDFLKLGELQLFLGRHSSGLENVAMCVKLDDNQKACMKLFRLIKKTEKTLKKAEEAIGKTSSHVAEILPDVEKALSAMKDEAPGLGEGKSYSLEQKARAAKVLCEGKIKV